MGVWRVAVEVTGPSLPDPAANIWHIRTGQEVGDADPGASIQDAMTALEAFYTAIRSTYPAGHNVSWDGEAQEMATDSPRVPSGLEPWGVAASGDAGLPAANALIIQWKTSLGSRRGRGRTFIGPITVGSAEANGTPTEPKRAELQAAAADLVASSSAVNAPPWAFGVWSPTDKVLRDFTASAVPNVIGVIRSRRD